MWDTAGKEYIDCMGGYGVALVGHCNDRVVRALENAGEILITAHMSTYNDTRLRFMEKITSVAPPSLSKIFFANSGAESVERQHSSLHARTGGQAWCDSNEWLLIMARRLELFL